jgi:hypothetical protein
MIRQLLLSETEPGTHAARPSPPGVFALLSAEFPTVVVRLRAPRAPGPRVRLEASEWRAPGFDPSLWDERVFDAAAQALPREGLLLHITGAPLQALAATALEMLTRYQGLIGRRNAASRGALFDTLLAHHRALHDTSKPLVVADYRHALDTWQWVLRLESRADLALQIAALFHDVEWPRAEADTRVELPAHDYQAVKDAHAERGAEFASAVLAEVGVEPDLRERVRGLILRHERPAADPELALLNDADALSFFSLHASGFARDLPRPHTRRMVAHALGRLRLQQRWRLARIRLAPQVRRLLEEAMGAAPLPETRQESA